MRGDMTTSQDILAHYGKKGMKWGKRSSAAPKLGASKDAKRSAAAFKKAKTSGVKSLSNKELSDLNNRLGLEQKYSQLNPSASDKGKKFASNLLGNSVKAAVAGVVTQQVAKALKTVVK